MNIVILGSDGQLGCSLSREIDNLSYQVTYFNRSDLDICNFEKVEKTLIKIKPNILINAAAYTAVDNAENEREAAYLINDHAIRNIARVCKKIDCWLIHISTDYVFDGRSLTAYSEEDQTNPTSTYGSSKLKGEIGIKSSGCKYMIIRTAWLFSEFGSNFLKTMVKLGMKNSELNVVGDQIGCPTYAPDLAKAILETVPYLQSSKLVGIYHYAGNLSCSWADFAVSIFSEAVRLEILKRKPCVNEILSKNYPTLAARPMNSRLDSSKFETVFKIKPSDYKLGIKLSLRALYR
jgi:dTDP-4-dehydrorhamnose reductase